jgi:hypothetical protein
MSTPYHKLHRITSFMARPPLPCAMLLRHRRDETGVTKIRQVTKAVVIELSDLRPADRWTETEVRSTNCFTSVGMFA